MTRSKRTAQVPIRLAIWFGKGGIGKSTTTMMLSLFAAKRGRKILTIDLDPECGTSRDFLGKELPKVQDNLKTFLESSLPVPPPILPSGIDGLDIVPCAPDEQRFFRLFPEKSSKLREALDLLPPTYDWILMDVPNQFDNVAELGLIAADYLLLPVELTADCVERVQTGLRIIKEARAFNPNLNVLGALALASMPRAGKPMGLSAKERMILREYEEAFKEEDIKLFDTLMFRSSTTVEEARSNADESLLHWTARRRFKKLVAEIQARITSSSLTPAPYGKRDRATQQSRSPAPANAR